MPTSSALKALCQSARIPLPLRPLVRLAQNEELGCTGSEAGRRGGLGKRAVTELERKHLVETDRHIAECKEYIAKQRELIERAIQRGRSTEVAETTLEALEASLRAARINTLVVAMTSISSLRSPDYPRLVFYPRLARNRAPEFRRPPGCSASPCR